MRRVLGFIALSLLACLVPAGSAGAATATQNERFTASDGITLQTTLTGEAPLGPRPTIVEFSPYGRSSGTFNAGPDFNHLLVQIRGTGDSDGSFDALGPRTQSDVQEVLRWACDQPWSDGTLGLNGFSASAITIYNSLHLKLPCVKAAVLKSGTFELYRDLLVPGGVSNLVPGAGVLALIGVPATAQGLDRLLRDPASVPDVIAGILGAGITEIQHPTLDDWWRERGFRGDVNHLPILMVDGFFDVESRGAFQGFQRLRRDGAHLVVIGAHDGAPKGTDAGAGEMGAWFEHYLRGAANGVQKHPRVQLWMSDGDREDMLDGDYVRYDATDWPVPGTRWRSYGLDAAKSGTAGSLNDGTLTSGKPRAAAEQTYPSVISLPTQTDPYNTAIVGGFGVNAITAAFPSLSEMSDTERLSLSYTTKPFTHELMSAGPMSLDVKLASTSPSTAIWAVVSDVAPDGTPHPISAGRLLSDFPQISKRKSLTDSKGEVVQPYGRYDRRDPASPGTSRPYHLEFFPIGNRFKAGHRLRLHLVGASAASQPSVPGLNTVDTEASHLLVPVLPAK